MYTCRKTDDQLDGDELRSAAQTHTTRRIMHDSPVPPAKLYGNESVCATGTAVDATASRGT